MSTKFNRSEGEVLCRINYIGIALIMPVTVMTPLSSHQTDQIQLVHEGPELRVSALFPNARGSTARRGLAFVVSIQIALGHP